MDQERLLRAIKSQGSALQQRAEWTQDIIDRQLRSIEKAQSLIDRAMGIVERSRQDLQANEIALAALRESYREIISQLEKESADG